MTTTTRPSRGKVAGRPFHWVIPDGAVYVGRQNFGLGRSPFANPHVMGKRCPGCSPRYVVHGTRAEVLALYRRHLEHNPELIERARQELVGKDLACFCKPEDPCHGDVLLEVVNGA
jgi:hypothetical protein